MVKPSAKVPGPLVTYSHGMRIEILTASAVVFQIRKLLVDSTATITFTAFGHLLRRLLGDHTMAHGSARIRLTSLALLFVFMQTSWCQTCSPFFGPAGTTACVDTSPRYSGKQWATCLSNAYIQQKSGGTHICDQESALYCWYQVFWIFIFALSKKNVSFSSKFEIRETCKNSRVC